MLHDRMRPLTELEIHQTKLFRNFSSTAGAASVTVAPEAVRNKQRNDFLWVCKLQFVEVSSRETSQQSVSGV